VKAISGLFLISSLLSAQDLSFGVKGGGFLWTTSNVFSTSEHQLQAVCGILF
jgi:hypothetical protein